MAIVNCEIQMDPSSSARELTVGKIFFLGCKGEWPKLHPEKIEFLVDKENKYALKLLKFDFVQPTEARLTVTSYEVGEHSIAAAQVIDGENSVVLGDLKFTVASVQNPQSPAKEPLGPFGPLHLGIAPIYWISTLLVIAFVLGFLAVRFFQRRRTQRQLLSMKLESYAQEPLQYFYSSLRKLQRNNPLTIGQTISVEERGQFVSDVKAMVDLYLARKFRIPTQYWGARKIFREIQKQDEFLILDIGPDLRKFLFEVEKVLKRTQLKNQLQDKDCLQYSEIARKLVEKIEQYFKKNNQESR